MKIDVNNLEDSLFDIVDQVRILLSEEIWENIFLNATKNEIFVMLILYRNSEVNMSQIAQYLGVPLNTATGIVGRMEKKKLIERVRSEEDKRIVTIRFTTAGREQVQNIMQSFIFYGQKIVMELSPQEIGLIGSVISKVISLLKEEGSKTNTTVNKVRKIAIE